MTSRREPTGSAHSEGWVLVTHEENRDERHPQYNEDNESSAQLASVSAPTDDDSDNLACCDNDKSTEYENNHSALFRKTESNGTSTETASTDTMTGLDAGHAAGNGVVNIHPVLTEYSLGRLQSELRQNYTADIHGWVEGTFNLYAHVNDVEPSLQNSMLVRPGKSKASTVSSMSLDHEPTQSAMPAAHDFAKMGSWC
jgi:hypothetical protein